MQIIQKTTRITAQEEVQGVTVMYSYESENEANPIAVAFSARWRLSLFARFCYHQQLQCSKHKLSRNRH